MKKLTLTLLMILAFNAQCGNVVYSTNQGTFSIDECVLNIMVNDALKNSNMYYLNCTNDLSNNISGPNNNSEIIINDNLSIKCKMTVSYIYDKNDFGIVLDCVNKTINKPTYFQ